MESEIAEPLHTIGLAVFLCCALVSLWRAHNGREVLLSLALLTVSVSEAMKAPSLVTAIRDAGVSVVVWRAAVQVLCLLALLLLLESLRSAVWGALWTSRPGRRSALALIPVAALMILLAFVCRDEQVRIEDRGGILPAVYLAAFSVPMLVMCLEAIRVTIRYRAQMTIGRGVACAVIIAFAADSGSLLVSYLASGESSGRGDGGVLWMTLWGASAVVLLGSLRRRSEDSPAVDLEYRVVRVWRALYGMEHGPATCDPAIERRRAGGIALAWTILVRECVDIIAARSRLVPMQWHNPRVLLAHLLMTDQGAEVVAAPYVVRSVGELGALSAGLPE